MNISIIILTRDEEKNIEFCLNSVSWSDDIVVLDSFSKDNTLKIARKYNTRIFQRKFDNYARQRNFGIKNIEYKNDWLLMVDADEVVTRELKNEMFDVLNTTDASNSLFYIRRKDYFWGRWIKHSSGYPTWFGRLIRIGHVIVTRSINEQYETDGVIGFLNNHLFHYPFRKGLDYWIMKHNRYSTLESLIYKEEKINFLEMFACNPLKRRRAFKRFIYRLPARPLVYFISIYFFRKGFLDGIAGFHFCILKTVYEYFICCKIKDKKMMKN